jgi:NADPH:quinone reductase-like Zn-dependent oxidoreductase
VPSLPGYAFSQRPSHSGVDRAFVARPLRLRQGLGYERYGAHGGDFGAGSPRTWRYRSLTLAVADLIEAGKLMPVLGRTYPLADTAAGLRHLEDGHTRGKAVITVT